MPPKSLPKPYFFYGPRKPSQNRPVVHGGLFSNCQILKTPQNPPPPSHPFDLRKWDPHHLSQNPSPPSIPNPQRNPISNRPLHPRCLLKEPLHLGPARCL
ncbi:hypothetical protein PTKIN_Ptkin13bG0277800 [Pterospermum kingtungense]